MNYFITDEGLAEIRRQEQAIINKYGSESNLKLRVQMKLGMGGMDDSEEDDCNPVQYNVNGAVAILGIDGQTRTNSTWITRFCGIPTYDDIKVRFQQAYEDSAVKVVLLNINSQGGQANGTHAMSEFIANFNSKIKPVIGYTSAACCSAAVWYGTAGAALSADADADIGSIGAINVFMSESRALKEAGIDVHVTRSAPYKAVPCSLEKLDDKGREILTAQATMWHNRFVNGLSENIGVTPENINKNIASGKVFTAQQALSFGLIKSIIPFEKLIANLNSKFDNSTSVPGRA